MLDRARSSRDAASATSSRAARSPASSSSCATPTTAAWPAACSTASRSSSTASVVPDTVPLWTLQGRTLTLDELRASTDVRWQLDEPATITVPQPGGLSAGVHRLEVVVHLRRSYFPPMVSRSTFTGAGASGSSCRRRPTAASQYGVSTYSYTGDIYTSMTLEDVVRRHRRPRRHRHRDPRRGQHPRLPDADHRVDRRAGTGCWRRYGLTADQLRLLGRHRRCGTTAT